MVKSMDRSGAEFFTVELTAFYLGRSYTVLALSFRGTLGCQEQDHPWPYLLTVWTFIVRPRQYLSSARALGLSIKWDGVINSLTPYEPLKILLPLLLVGKEGFDDTRLTSRLA